MTLRLTPTLVMDGNAKEAIQFYKTVFDAKAIHIQTYGEIPIPCPAALKERVANVLLRLGEGEMMVFDTPGIPVQDGNKVVITLSTKDVETTKQIFGKLQHGGKVVAPLEEVPFSPAFGTVTDKFGVTFMIVTEGKN